MFVSQVPVEQNDGNSQICTFLLSSQCVHNDYSHFNLCNSSLFSRVSTSVYNNCVPISGTWNGERVTHVYAQATRAAKSPLGICDSCLRQRSLHPGGQLLLMPSATQNFVFPKSFLSLLLVAEIRIGSGTLNFLKGLEFIRPVQAGIKLSSSLLYINAAKGRHASWCCR